MRIYPTLSGLLLSATLFSGCSTETGSEFITPDKTTSPPISFGTHFPVDNTGGTIVPNYSTLGADSADLTVNFGSKAFTFGDRDMTLDGFGTFTGSKEIHRFSVQEDSRGIKAVRQGLYHVRDNDYDDADFHYLAKDSSGNNTTGGWTTDPAQEINWLGEQNYTIYSANFMNYLRSDPNAIKTRLQVVQEVVADVVNSSNGINIGLMRFSQNQEGGQVSYAMESIDTARAGFISALNAYYPSGPTPLTEVLWEAMKYYRGDPVDYGIWSTPGRQSGRERHLMR